MSPCLSPFCSIVVNEIDVFLENAALSVLRTTISSRPHESVYPLAIVELCLRYVEYKAGEYENLRIEVSFQLFIFSFWLINFERKEMYCNFSMTLTRTLSSHLISLRHLGRSRNLVSVQSR